MLGLIALSSVNLSSIDKARGFSLPHPALDFLSKVDFLNKVDFLTNVDFLT